MKKSFIVKQQEKETSTVIIAIWYVISNLLVKGLGIITTPIFTRILTKEQYGQFSNFCAWEGILSIIITLQLLVSIPRAKYDFNNSMNKYISSITLFSNFFTILVYIFVELNKTFFSDLFSMDIQYIRILFVYLFFSPVFNFLQAKHRIYKKYKMVAFLSITIAIIRTIVSIAAVVLMQDRLLARVFGYVVPFSIMNACIWIFVIVKGQGISWKCCKYALLISLPLILHALSGNLLNTSDRIMITKFLGSEKNALYTLAYSVASIISLIWMSMNQAWTPWLYDKLYEGKRELIRKQSKFYFGIFALMTIAVLLIAPEIVLILGGHEYYEVRFIMPPVIVGCVFQFIFGMYINLEIYAKKSWMISAGTIGAAVINVILNFIFIPKYGYMSAAYTTLISYFVLMLFHYLIVQGTGEFVGVYDQKFIFILAFLIFIIHIVCIFLYYSLILRYIVLAAYIIILCVVAFKYKNKIFNFIEKRGYRNVK